MSSSEAITTSPSHISSQKAISISADSSHTHSITSPQISASDSSASTHLDNIDAGDSMPPISRRENKDEGQALDTGTCNTELCSSTNPPKALLDSAPPKDDSSDRCITSATAPMPDASGASRCETSFRSVTFEEKSQEPIAQDGHISNNNSHNTTMSGSSLEDDNPYASLNDFDFIIDDRAAEDKQNQPTETSVSSHSLPLESASDRTTDLDSPNSTGGNPENPISIRDDEKDGKPSAMVVLDHATQSLDLQSTEGALFPEDSPTNSTKSQETQRVVKRSRTRETQGSAVSSRPTKSARRSGRLSGKVTDYTKYTKVNLSGRYGELEEHIQDVQKAHQANMKVLRQQKQECDMKYKRDLEKLQRQSEKFDAIHESGLEKLRQKSEEFGSFLELFG